jgi:hypothetical protein
MTVACSGRTRSVPTAAGCYSFRVQAQASKCCHAPALSVLVAPEDASAAGWRPQQTRLVAMVGHTRRFNPSHQWVRQCIKAGESAPGIAMDMSNQLKAANGAICTLSLSFDTEGPMSGQGTLFRDIGTTGA